MRDEDGALVEASWPEALERAAAGLREAVDRGGVGVLPGGRLTEEDAYAYAKFARVALGTNDIDFRARPGRAEELDFLAAHVAGTDATSTSPTPTSRRRPRCCWSGFEPEEESPIVFLRLRKSTRHGATPVWSVAAARLPAALSKLGGDAGAVPARRARRRPLDSLPGTVAEALGADGALILVGERLASAPGALSAAAALAARHRRPAGLGAAARRRARAPSTPARCPTCCPAAAR